jgi:hypothetical protein
MLLMAFQATVAEQNTRIRETLLQAFDAEIEARAADSTCRPVPPTPVAADAAGLMKADKEPVRVAALTICAAKAAYPTIDTQALQGGDIDFRSRATNAVVPLLREITTREKVAINYRREPLVSNPYREKRLDADWIDGRRGGTDQALAQNLVNIATFLNHNPARADDVLAEIVAEHLDLWGRQRIEYAVPPRVSHALVMKALRELLATSAGGTHLEWVSVALLRFAGERWQLWDEVQGHAPNDSLPYDAICLLKGAPVALSESKDIEVTTDQVRQLSYEVHARHVTRGFFFTRDAHLVAHREEIDEFVARRHSFGERIAVLDLLAAAHAWLTLADASDEDLPSFLRLVCDVLDEWSGLASRKLWAEILASL